MLPNNTISTIAHSARFKSPYDMPVSALSRSCRGGIAINDSSKGRDYQNWYVWYANGNVYYGPEATPLVSVGSLALTGVLQLSMAFDNNMNPIICWLDSTGAHIRYFSGTTSTYVVVDVLGATSCLVAVDDSRNFYNANSDAIFAYTISSGLWYRYQRQNYATPIQASTSTARLIRMGMHSQNRFQFERTV